MSSSETPPEVTRQLAWRGDAESAETYMEILQEESGVKALLHYARKYERAGNDLDKLANELQVIIEECGAEDIKNFLTDPDGVDEFLTNLNSIDSAVRVKFFSKLNAEINFLK